MRCLALIFLVLAFAQPIIRKGSEAQSENKAICVYIDNSFSMKARKDEVELFVLAKDNARDIIQSYDDTDLFLVITNDLEAKHQRFVDKTTALGFIDEIGFSPESEALEEVCRIVARIGQNKLEHKKYMYLLSDFQENISRFTSAPDSLTDYKLIAFRSLQENNVAVKEISLDAPVAIINQANRLVVKLENFGDNNEDVELRMNYKDQERPLGTLSLDPKSSVIDTISLALTEAGWHDVELVINDFPIEFDNNYFTSLHIKEKYRTLTINEANSNEYLKTAFESISSFEFTEQGKNNVRYDEFKNYQLIVLDDLLSISTGLAAELAKYLESGGCVLLFPSERADLGSYNDFLSKVRADRLGLIEQGLKTVSEINKEEFIFKDVFQSDKKNIRLPETTVNYSLQKTSQLASSYLMRYRDGTAYLQRYDIGQGQLFLSTAPLNKNSNNLVISAEIFIPMLYKMALSAGQQKEIAYVIGKDDIITLDLPEGTSRENYIIKGRNEFIPGISTTSNSLILDIRGQIKQSGIYELWSGNELISKLAFNYDRTESDVRFAELKDLADQMGANTEILSNVALADISAFINEQHHGLSLWRWCVMLSLFFLLIESLLLRFWK